jgi:hypothetical protein
VPSRLMAGAYPGDPDPDEHQAKVQVLLSAGDRLDLRPALAKA